MRKLDELTELICDLYWEYDRMSSSGQETLDKMADILGVSMGAAPTIGSLTLVPAPSENYNNMGRHIKIISEKLQQVEIELDNARKECIRNGHRDSGRGVCVDCGEFLDGME